VRFFWRRSVSCVHDSREPNIEPRSSRSTQPLEPHVIDPVAFAGGLCETVMVDDGYLAAKVSDKPGALEFLGGHGYSRTPHPEHRRQKLVRHRHHSITSDPVRSLAISSHRAQRCSIECRRLHAAVCELKFSMDSVNRRASLRTPALRSNTALHPCAAHRRGSARWSDGSTMWRPGARPRRSSPRSRSCRLRSRRRPTCRSGPTPRPADQIMLIRLTHTTT
jgi:hypothetical protein